MKLYSKSIMKRKIPFYGIRVLCPQKLEKKSQQNEQSPGNIEPYESGSGNDADVVITGVSSYAQAAQKPPAAINNMSTIPGTAYIGKKVTFN